MSKRFQLRSFLASSAVIASLCLTAGIAAASPAQTHAKRVEHVITGEVKRIDHKTMTLAIHTAEGVDETVKFTARTTVHGAKDVTLASDKAAKALLEGGTAVVVVTGEGVERTAVKITHVAKPHSRT